MKMTRLILIMSFVASTVSFIFFIVSCGNSYSSRSDVIEIRNNDIITNQLGVVLDSSYSQISPIFRLILKGDKEAYDVLVRAYKLSNRMDETFAYSLIMAFKYNHSSAYYNIYDSFANLYGENTLDSLDEYSKHMALMCLSKAAHMGNIQARKEEFKLYQYSDAAHY